MKPHYFIITVDTEGDNLWNHLNGEEIKTNNSLFLIRFQKLCAKYNFKPVWLVNYEMAKDKRFSEGILPFLNEGMCEIGIHLHAWNTPPDYCLDGSYQGNPYLIEYPKNVRREKFRTLYDLLTSTFGKAPVSHRAGRWAMDEDYFKILEEFNIKVDCSVTPGVSWENNPGISTSSGADYSHYPPHPYMQGNVLEVPVSIKYFRTLRGDSFKHCIKHILYGERIWLRPTSYTFGEMKLLCDRILKNGPDYLEFMIHSSEFMPGGSPYFKTEKSVEDLFFKIERLFVYLSRRGCVGITLQEYQALYNSSIR